MELYCGIDLHSNTLTVSIITKARKELVQKRLANDLGEVLKVLEPYRKELVGVAVESTYNWYWLVDGLMENGYCAHLGNMNEAQQYKGMKHRGDRHDANWVAFMLALGILPEGYIYPKKDRPLRDLCRRRAFLVKSRTRMFNATRAVFESWTGDRLTRNEVKGWTDDDLEQLIADSRTRLGISCMLAPVLEMNHQIELIEKRVLKEAVLREEFKLLETVWGIGKILALTVMYEVGEVSRFSSVGNFSSYCRLVDSKYTSNGKRKGKGNKKNGNPYLSWAFSEAAHFAVGKYPEAKRFYQRKKASSPHEMVAKRSLAAKLARASFYVMRDKVEFDPAKLF